uniref:Gustatory receptor n=1 Tax=Strigamia maritima TaxID=126957 RepID=T1JMM1_STRMM
MKTLHNAITNVPRLALTTRPQNLIKMKPTSKLLIDYAVKLKSFWSIVFNMFGLAMCSDGIVSRKKKTIMCLLAILQLTILLHYIVCYINTIALESTISKFGHYSGLIINGSMSVFTLWVMHKRRISMTKLLDNSIHYLNKHTEYVKILWNHSLIPSLGLFAMTIAGTCIAVVDVFIQDNSVIRKYSAMYLLRTNLAEEDLYIARVVMSVEFVVSLLVSVGFVSITVWFFICMCHLVFYRFKCLNMKLEKILTSGEQLSSFDLAEYRKEHQLACQVTEELSCLWSPLIGFWIFGLVLNLTFDLRSFQMGTSTLFMIAYMTDIIRELWLLVSLFKAGSIVNIEAHKLAEKLVTSNISKSRSASTNEQIDYNINYVLLTERLVSTRIGINASGMFLLNASSFLHMAGTVVTYVIVLYQSR